ncbi:MAG TPA: alpha/beta hydrolase, partial [Myxococcota bacterium]|nr:alpha/beta hydrolase [Myxococcota bacterium]
ERPLARLVLESTFTSVRAMASDLFGIPGWLVRDPFDNLAAVRAFTGPILQLHGDRDQSIPLAHAQALHDAAPRSELHVLHCGHNDCAHSWELIAPFLLARDG